MDRFPLPRRALAVILPLAFRLAVGPAVQCAVASMNVAPVRVQAPVGGAVAGAAGAGAVSVPGTRTPSATGISRAPSLAPTLAPIGRVRVETNARRAPLALPASSIGSETGAAPRGEARAVSRQSPAAVAPLALARGTQALKASAPNSGPDAFIPRDADPARELVRRYGGKAAFVARAYELAERWLGEVHGVFGSYARGEARIGAWPAEFTLNGRKTPLTATDVEILDKLPMNLPEKFLKQLGPRLRALYRLKRRMGRLPSDLDILAAGEHAVFKKVKADIFRETGVLVEFKKPPNSRSTAR
ncbi:MAG: hypothetical protein ABII00_07910 [Elusimicrobiota bacterium]